MRSIDVDNAEGFLYSSILGDNNGIIILKKWQMFQQIVTEYFN